MTCTVPAPTTTTAPSATTPGLNCENVWEAPSGWTAGDEPDAYFSLDCVDAPTGVRTGKTFICFIIESILLM